MASLRILALIGSSRNEASETFKTIQLIEQKMNLIQPAEVEYIFIQKLGIPFCDGCLSCVSVGEDTCPEYSRIGPIAQRMDNADGIILGAPVYTFNISGLMKNFVEYFMYKRNRPSFFGKKAVVVTAASGGGHKVVLDFLEGTASAWGCDVVSRIGVSSSQMRKERYVRCVDETANDVAKTFVAEIEKGELGSPQFPQLMNFRAMQNMTRGQKGLKNHAYWEKRNWLNAEYYTDVPISPLARVMAGWIARKMRKSIRKGNVTPVR